MRILVAVVLIFSVLAGISGLAKNLEPALDNLGMLKAT